MFLIQWEIKLMDQVYKNITNLKYSGYYLFKSCFLDSQVAAAEYETRYVLLTGNTFPIETHYLKICGHYH